MEGEGVDGAPIQELCQFSCHEVLCLSGDQSLGFRGISARTSGDKSAGTHITRTKTSEGVRVCYCDECAHFFRRLALAAGAPPTATPLTASCSRSSSLPLLEVMHASGLQAGGRAGGRGGGGGVSESPSLAELHGRPCMHILPMTSMIQSEPERSSLAGFNRNYVITTD